MIHLDTSVLIDAFCGDRASAATARTLLAEGHALAFSSLVLFEWRRGPRTSGELTAQETMCPSGGVVAFGGADATVAADLYRRLGRPRGRIVDLAIAATAIVHGARLWTLNRRDFADIPRLQLYG
jgi:predicted nucleic acid-binding protein